MILCTYCDMEDEEARGHVGTCVRVDAQNKIISAAPEIPGPQMPPKYETA